jgi:eukaryotic-like serine/threonine-protein kinase
LLFDRYRLQRRIGRGGTADVWQARDERLDRTVAIKALHPHLLPDVASRARFATEARAAAGLSHPAIVPVHDVIEDADAPAIVLAFVDGSTLAQRLARDGAMPASIAASIAADVAGALAHAHRAGVVHRDVKPGNVLIDGDGRVQLVDFGIARLLADAAARETATGQVMGTLRYMAPEQLAGQPVDERTDLYALGLVVHELLAGRPAFGAGSPAALVDAQRAGPPTPPAGTPPELASLLSELLAVDPDDRPTSATEVEARLRAIAGPDRIAPQPEGPAAPDTTSPVGQVLTIAQPTIAAGLPAAAVGLAMLAPQVAVAAPASPPAGPARLDLDGDESGDPRDPADPTEPREPETLAFEAPPTVSVAVVAAVAPAPSDPQTARGARATRRGVPVAVLAGGGLAAGAIALALALAGARGQSASLVTASHVPTPLVTASTTPPTVAPAPAQHKPPRGHGHRGGK